MLLELRQFLIYFVAFVCGRGMKILVQRKNELVQCEALNHWFVLVLGSGEPLRSGREIKMGVPLHLDQ